MFFSKKKLTADELGELRAVNRLVKEQSFLADVVAKNTYYVHKGQQWLKTQIDVVKLLKKEQSDLIGALAKRHGFKVGVPVTVNLQEGTIEAAKKVESENPVAVPEDLGVPKE